MAGTNVDKLRAAGIIPEGYTGLSDDEVNTINNLNSDEIDAVCNLTSELHEILGNEKHAAHGMAY